jgi:hypothetical protein
VLRIFIAPKNPSPWRGSEPATFGSSGHRLVRHDRLITAWILTFRKLILHVSHIKPTVSILTTASNVLILHSDYINDFGAMLDSTLYFYCHVDFVYSQARRSYTLYHI